MKTLSGLLVGLAAALLPMYLGAMEDLTGSWMGRYYYGNRADSGSFVVAVSTRERIGGRPAPPSGLTYGECVEPNIFGGTDAPTQRSGVVMRLYDDNRFEMSKRYDGSFGASHAVWYSGTYDPETDTIKGVWYLSESAQGSFTMAREKAAGPGAGRAAEAREEPAEGAADF